MGDTISWDEVFKKAKEAENNRREGTDKRSSRAGGRASRGGSGKGGPISIGDLTFKPRSKRFWVIAIIVFILVVAALYWWFHPPLNIHSSGLWWFVLIVICLPAFLIFRGLRNSNASKGDSDAKASKKARRYRFLSWIPLAVLVVFVVGSIASSTIFNAKRYANVLVTDEYDFASDIDQVDYSQIPVIDHDSAVLLGNRTLGEISDYVSQFEISDLYSQINYNGVPTRVSPLGYADIFKWLSNRGEGIPAYVKVDMTTQDTEVVRLSQGMKYTASEPLARNINRYVQLKYPFYLFEEFSFEVDDDGNPYWVCPVQTRTIGLFGGETISRVVLVDACTGQCTDMEIDEVPQWIDRAYPSDLLIEQYNWSGAYSGGWWNSWIGQKGVKQTTPGTDGQLGYNYIAKDDDVWVYTGVTSATSDNSIIGFVLINQRTAESHFYSVAGATEESAMASAEGQVQNLEYTATFPILLNIDDQPTYFMALKDAAGLVKKYAMIDIQRYQNVAIGDTVSDCQTSYETLLVTTGVLTEEQTDVSSANKVSGTVSLVSSAVLDGNTHIYLQLEGDERLYDCALPDLMIAVTLREGDRVSLSYIDGEDACSVIELASES